jgi:hypothetical protein
MLAAALSGSETGNGAFAQNVALEFERRPPARNRGIEHLARGGARVDMFGQRSQCHATLAQSFGRVEQMPQAPSDPIEFPDDEGITRGKSRDRALEPRSRSQRPEAGAATTLSGQALTTPAQRRRRTARRDDRVERRSPSRARRVAVERDSAFSFRDRFTGHAKPLRAWVRKSSQKWTPLWDQRPDT